MTAQTPARDIRIDFFRGLALIIIFINHTPGNIVGMFTPRVYGLSDAAEIFIFLAGLSSAMAFGRSFDRAGFLAGFGRVAQRVWQLYRAHIGLFIAICGIIVGANSIFAEPNYISRLGIDRFFDSPGRSLFELLSLHYVPHYFDILPLYMLLLAAIPAMVLLSRISPVLVVIGSAVLYVGAVAGGWNLTADSTDGRGWFFNPFAWQVLFVAGYGYGAGWFEVPRATRGRITAALIYLVFCAALALSLVRLDGGLFAGMRDILEPLARKTDIGPLRLLHFFALAYVVVSLLRAAPGLITPRGAEPMALMGRHSLSVFLLGMALSFIGGIVLDQAGTGILPHLAVNLGGIALLWLWARGAAWFNGQPWKRRAAAPRPVTAHRIRPARIAPMPAPAMARLRLAPRRAL
ncbi:OpgC family protein [Inquilinus limosus]|uniref:OpgC family protein n=1 Tax=Inquilinus limosus TaxID=171674 RepID=UPI0009DBAC2C|nr:OpgC domain-containing protein [Inquilinus limosus]